MPITTTRLEIQPYKDIDFTRTLGSVIVGDFNPSDYKITRSNNYRPRPTTGTSKPTLAYASGNNDTLDITFLFDGTGVRDARGTVQDRVNTFLELLEYRGEEHEPAYAKLTWGTLLFRGVLKSANTDYQLFDRDGSPLRAKITAQFEEVVSNKERIAEESSSSPDVDRVWVVRAGDRIDQIAYESYGNVAYWPQLAKANGLGNPRSLVVGAVLSLPRLVRS